MDQVSRLQKNQHSFRKEPLHGQCCQYEKQLQQNYALFIKNRKVFIAWCATTFKLTVIIIFVTVVC